MGQIIQHDASYVKWVQRSLNRELKKGLAVDGVPTIPYRKAVGEFNEARSVVQEPGLGIDRVGRKCQDTIIHTNHQCNDYVDWLRLVVPNAPPKPANSFGVDEALKKAVKKYQSHNGLDDDGWVGPWTETKLIALSGKEPPGSHANDQGKGGGPPNTKDLFVVAWNRLSGNERYLKMCERARSEIAAGVLQGKYDVRFREMARKMAHANADGTPVNFAVFTVDDVERLKLASQGKKIDKYGRITDEIDPKTGDQVLYSTMEKGWYRDRIIVTERVYNHVIDKYMTRVGTLMEGGNTYPIISRADYERKYANHFAKMQGVYETILDGIGRVARLWGQIGEYPTLMLARNFIIALGNKHWHVYKAFRDQLPAEIVEGLTFPY